MTQIEPGTEVNLTDGAVVQASVGTPWVPLSDESVVLDVLTDRVFRLNSTAAFIWELLQEPRRVGELHAAVATAYRIDETETRNATDDLLRQLLAESLIGTTAQGTGTW